MNALFYLSLRSTINKVKQIKTHPSKAFPLLFALLFVGMGMANLFLSSKPLLTGEALDASIRTYQLSIFAILLLAGLGNLLTSISKGTFNFIGADTQFLFLSPYRSQTLLVYGLMRSFKAQAISVLYMIYYMPDLKATGLSIRQVFLVFLTYLLGLVAIQGLSSLCYALVDGKPLRRKLFSWTIWALALALLPLLGLLFFKAQGRLNENAVLLDETLSLFIKHPYVQSLPIFGWCLSIVQGFYQGFSLWTWVKLFALLCVPLLSLLVLYKMKVDFYEDALAACAMTPGNKDAQQAQSMDFVRKALDGKKVRGLGLKHGYGLSAVFFRQWKDLRRMRPYVYNVGALLSLGFACLVAYLMRPVPLADQMQIFTVYLGVFAVFTALNAQASTLAIELHRDSFFLLPLRPLGLLAISNLAESLYLLATYIPIGLIFWLYAQLPFRLCLMLVLTLLSLRLLLSGASLILIKLLGGEANMLSYLLSTFLAVLFLAPSIVIFLKMALPYLGMTLFSHLIFPAFPLMIVVNLLLYLVSMTLGLSQFKHGRKS